MRVGVALLVLGATWWVARASGPDETISSPEMIAGLEQKADAAAVKDQCFLYTELLHALTELEGRQVGAGDSFSASATLERMERVAMKMKAAETADARRVKNAEQLLAHTTQRMGDMLHLASGEERAAMKATLDHMNKLHEDMLAMVFAK
jgi:methylphosphotriester-DNA--protein-cysteine methyltransferase